MEAWGLRSRSDLAMHSHHRKWIGGLRQLSLNPKEQGSSSWQLGYTIRWWTSLPLSAPQRKHLLATIINTVVYICYFCKSPQQYHGIYVIIIITVVHVNRFICLTYGEHPCHSQGRKTEPKPSHRSR